MYLATRETRRNTTPQRCLHHKKASTIQALRPLLLYMKSVPSCGFLSHFQRLNLFPCDGENASIPRRLLPSLHNKEATAARPVPFVALNIGPGWFIIPAIHPG
jgi:hypothetical protein